MTFQELEKFLERDELKDCITRALLKVESDLLYFDKDALPKYKRLHEAWRFHLNEGVSIDVDTSLQPAIVLLIQQTIHKCMYYQIIKKQNNLDVSDNLPLDYLIKYNQEKIRKQ